MHRLYATTASFYIGDLSILGFVLEQKLAVHLSLGFIGPHSPVSL